VPFLLRKNLDLNATGNEYYLVGECYIDGMMDGEAMDLAKMREIILV